MIFREIVKDAMKERGITPLELARLTDKPRSTINNFLSDKSKSPSMELGGPVAKALKINLNALYDIEIPGMTKEEIEKLRSEHEALMTEYAYVKERTVKESQETVSQLERLKKDLDFTEKLYADAKNRIRWQIIMISVLLVLICIFACYALRLDSLLPGHGIIQY